MVATKTPAENCLFNDTTNEFEQLLLMVFPALWGTRAWLVAGKVNFCLSAEILSFILCKP